MSRRRCHSSVKSRKLLKISVVVHKASPQRGEGELGQMRAPANTGVGVKDLADVCNLVLFIILVHVC